MADHRESCVDLLQRAQRFLVDVAGFDALDKPLAQAADMAALQFLLDFAYLFLGRDQLAGLGRVLVHHHIQGKLDIALDTVREIMDFLAALRRELQFLHIQTFGEIEHDPRDRIGRGIEAG